MPPETRDRIVYAAMTLFARKGYSSTSVADILHEAGVHAGSLYHVFPGKQDVLLAVLDAYRHGLHPMLLEPAWKDVADPIDRVFALLQRYRKLLVSSDCTYGCPIGSIALELHDPDPADDAARLARPCSKRPGSMGSQRGHRSFNEEAILEEYYSFDARPIPLCVGSTRMSNSSR